MTRRELLLGTGAGALGVLLVSCAPEPTPTPTRSHTPIPTPTPTTEVPMPTASLRSAWATDPFSRGAVSYTRVGVQPEVRERLAEPLLERVFFAGEATDPSAPGTMSGAISSGERAAIRVGAASAQGERIAVIGAGLAGATVAAFLAPDHEVTVFEARDRIGGRVHSRLDDAWEVPVQLGGWLLPPLAEGEQPPAEESGLPDTVDLASALWRSPEGDVDPIGNAPLQAAITAAAALPTDVSFTEALVDAGYDPEDPALAAQLSYLETTAGADADVLSPRFPPALPSEMRRGVTGDFGPYLESRFENAQLTLSSPVTRIAYDDSGVSLRLGTGESTSFDRVVVTVPLGVLQSGRIEFSPELPFTHEGAINALGVGHIETIWMRYDEAFWETDATIWHTVGGDHAVRTWINLQPVTGESILVGIVGGSAAADFAELEEQEALHEALMSLAPFLPSAPE